MTTHTKSASPRPPQIIIEPSKGLISLQLSTLWHFRELLYFLVWKDVKIRYKQTALGVAWIILQPLISMLIFTLLFGVLLKVPSGEVPYPLFAYTALLPWNYFATSLSKSSTSVESNSNLVTKVYFPRMVIPLSSVLAGVLDLGIAFLVLIPLMAFFGYGLSLNMLFLPVFILLAMLTAFGFGLWLSALNVQYRDVNHLMPFLIQVWMYATPVIYSTSLIPEKFRWLLALNPMTGVVEGFRWALLGIPLDEFMLDGYALAISVVVCLISLISGLVFFRRTERRFADIL